jgi:hypothetical protein
VAGCYVHSNEPLGSIEGRGFLDQLSVISLSRRTLFHTIHVNTGMKSVNKL